LSMTIRPYAYTSCMKSGATIKTTTIEHQQRTRPVSSRGQTPIISWVIFFCTRNLFIICAYELKGDNEWCRVLLQDAHWFLMISYLAPKWDSTIKHFWFTLSYFKGHPFLHCYTH
jgi:hypothetical protein